MSAAINFLLPEAKIKRGEGKGRRGGGEGSWRGWGEVVVSHLYCLQAAAAAVGAQRAISKCHSIRLAKVQLASPQSSARKVSPASPSLA